MFVSFHVGWSERERGEIAERYPFRKSCQIWKDGTTCSTAGNPGKWKRNEKWREWGTKENMSGIRAMAGLTLMSGGVSRLL